MQQNQSQPSLFSTARDAPCRRPLRPAAGPPLGARVPEAPHDGALPAGMSRKRVKRNIRTSTVGSSNP